MKIIFPTIIYKCPGEHQCTGGTYGFIQVISESSLSEGLKNGYSLTLPEAMGEKPKNSPKPTRKEIEQKAQELKIPFNNRTTDIVLLKRIEEKIG